MIQNTAYGLDIVHAIDPQAYMRRTDEQGRARSFAMNEKTRNRLTAVIRDSLDDPDDVAAMQIHPGYVRVQIEPSAATSLPAPKEYVSPIRGVAGAYNSRHAGDRDVDGLQFKGTFVGTYRPEGSLDTDSFIERHVSLPNAPDSDGPVFEYTTDVDDEQRGRDHQRVAYEYTLPFAESMYEDAAHFGDHDSAGAAWGEDMIDRLAVAAENYPAWPGGTITRLEVWPEYVRIRHHGAGLAVAPEKHVGRCKRALSREFRLGAPSLAFADQDCIVALETPDGGSGAEEYIATHGLEDEDGEPRDPEGVDVDGEVDEGGVWNALNPFSGGD